MHKSNNIEPWERQNNESTQAYAAFKCYLDMGEDRSLRRVEQKLAKSHALISRWSVRWNWQERIRQYDNEMVRAEISAKKNELSKMFQRHSGMSTMLQKKALEALKVLDIDELTPNMILQFIIAGARLEEKALNSLILANEQKIATEVSDNNDVEEWARQLEEMNRNE